MTKKEQEKKKIMKKTIKEATKKKFQTLKTDDMKPFVHLRQDDIVIDEDTENIDEQTEESVIESKVLMNEAEYREIKQESVDNEKNKGFQYDDEFRIDDEELQSLIDSQLNNFESFKIQRQEKDEETDLEKLRKKAFEVYENQMEKAFDTDIEDFEVTTMTNIEDEDPEGKIKTSTGNDNILLGKNNKRRREQMK